MIGWTAAPWPDLPGVLAGCSTRAGGVSRPPFDSANMADHTGDAPAAVRSNRDMLASQLGLAGIQWLTQVHGNGVVNAPAPSAPSADASWTREPGVGLAIMTADCVPVLVADERARFVGAAHAGWRGLLDGVLEALLDALPERDHLRAWVGPAISQQAYEVDRPVVGPVRERGLEAHLAPAASAGRWLFDLPGAAAEILRDQGVRRVDCSGLCTHRDPRFYSYRRDGQTGRMVSVVARISVS